jgi:peptidoglycan/LPS O-acetylase OafA/YrhL
VLRIIPPYYLAILGFALANALIFDVDALSALTHFIQQLLFLQSLDYGLLSSNLAALWYLGLLMQFYLVFPWVLDLFRRLGAWQASLLILAVCWGGTGLLSFYLSVHPHSPLGMTGYMIHFNLPARLPEFALGMWMAASWRSRARVGRERPLAAPFTWFLLTMAAFALLGAPFAKETDLLPFSLYPVAVCLTLFVALFLWPLVSRLGHCRLVARMSAASYSIYILHQPTFSYLGVVPGNHTGSIATFTLLALVFLPICYLLATALDRLSGLVMEIASAKPQRPTEPGICAAEPCRPDASEES